ncbi:MAG: DUF445 domain-containing protein [Bacillota bacterium]|nr:DUF445 domain-containing protein [Bacillota bacterium]
MRNKRLADRLLIILLASFILVTFIKIRIYTSFYMELSSFVLEAALIGGIADWFAITALYRKPLGFSWHTAIIPRNREKVIDAISNVVQQELLSRQTLKNRINDIRFVDSIIAILDSSMKNEDTLAELGKNCGVKLLNSIDTYKIAHMGEKAVKAALAKLSLTDLLNRVIMASIESESYEKPLGELLDYLVNAVGEDKTREEISGVINELINKNMDSQRGVRKALMKFVLGVAEGTDSFNVRAAAVSIQKELIELLRRLKNPKDPLHLQFLNNIRRELERVSADELTVQAIENWKMETIKNVNMEQELGEVIQNIRHSLIFAIEKTKDTTAVPALSESDGDINSQIYSESVSSVINWSVMQVLNYWKEFEQNERAKRAVDGFIRDFASRITETGHEVIGVIVKKCLSGLTDDALNDFIERKAGNDLHWIRINGCIVGAIFGLIVFLFTHIILFYITGSFSPLFTILINT